MEALDEHERHEANNLPRESRVFSPEMLAVRTLVDTIGAVALLDIAIDEQAA